MDVALFPSDVAVLLSSFSKRCIWRCLYLAPPGTYNWELFLFAAPGCSLFHLIRRFLSYSGKARLARGRGLPAALRWSRLRPRRRAGACVCVCVCVCGPASSHCGPWVSGPRDSCPCLCEHWGAVVEVAVMGSIPRTLTDKAPQCNPNNDTHLIWIFPLCGISQFYVFGAGRRPVFQSTESGAGLLVAVPLTGREAVNSSSPPCSSLSACRRLAVMAPGQKEVRLAGVECV